jgi:hypothetical protein
MINKMTENPTPPKSRFELFVEFIRVLAWPLFAFVLLYALWTPIRSIAALMPNIIERSETITIANLSIKVGRGIKRKASADVLKVLTEITPDGLRKLISSSDEAYWQADSKSYARTENAEIIRLKLVEEVSKKELGNYGYGIKPTTLGEETKEYVLVLVSEFVNELKRNE